MPLTVQPPPVVVPFTIGSSSGAASEVVPPYTVADAPMIAALQAEGYTVTAAVVTPPVTPPASGWDYVMVGATGLLDPYWGGANPPTPNLEPGGNWDVNCTQSVGAKGVDGVGCLAITPTGANCIWLPYPVGLAGQPQSNGIGVDLTGKTEITLDVAPSAAGMVLAVGLYSTSGKYVGKGAQTVDALIKQVVIANNPPVGKFTTYTASLASLGLPYTNPLGQSSMFIYKVGCQNNGVEQTFELRNVSFK